MEPAIVIDGKLYVVTDSVMNGGINYKSLVGPKGGVYCLVTYNSGRKELLGKNMTTTLWSGR